MNQYYLIAQLPSLEIASETTALPITEERFYELCRTNLGKKAWNALSGLTLVPGRQNKKSGYSFIDKWNEWEKNFRLALAAARAEKLKKPFEGETGACSGHLLQTVRQAVGDGGSFGGRAVSDPRPPGFFWKRCALRMPSAKRCCFITR